MKGKRVLVVDDEGPIRDLLRDAITEAGAAVDTAADATAALQLIKDHLYDAAVLDFALPDMDGVRLHSEIRRMDEELAHRTLFISGVTQPAERLDYFGSDAGGFLSKPFDVADLVSRLERMVES
jgi:DNA-binding response OmpR family regulator